MIKSFSSPDTHPLGIAFDGRNLWISARTDDKIYCVDKEGNVITSFATPGASPNALAFDGVYLWHADAGTAFIYQIRI